MGSSMTERDANKPRQIDPQAPAPPPSPAAPAEVAQSDIDALLKAAAADAPAPAAAAAPAADADEGVLSEGVLDQLIADARSAARQIEQTTAGAAVAAEPPPPPPGARALALDNLAAEADGEPVASVDLLRDVSMRVKIELGRTKMYVEDVLRLGRGSVVELDKLAGDPVDVFVNERLVAHGEVLVLNDNFCVRINEICASAGSQGA
jgi:flagellar motor switch protein FliN/FliY